MPDDPITYRGAHAPLSSTDTKAPAWGVVVDALAAALRGHRADMHHPSNRPCRTCSASAQALALYDAKNAETGRRGR